MEEINNGISSSSSSRKNRGRARFSVDEGGDSSVECSGKHCRSCAATLLADCVAMCCCPLALVSLLALAFVKIPYLAATKCLKKRKKNKRKCNKIDQVINNSVDYHNHHHIRDINLISGRLSHTKSDIIFEFGKDNNNNNDDQQVEERKSFCAAFEADKVLFELYQVGHLGFGRVSFTGIQSFSKENQG
ncbi:unnamed protein product [Amaranthus hypochondriacus]